MQVINFMKKALKPLTYDNYCFFFNGFKRNGRTDNVRHFGLTLNGSYFESNDAQLNYAPGYTAPMPPATLCFSNTYLYITVYTTVYFSTVRITTRTVAVKIIVPLIVDNFGYF